MYTFTVFTYKTVYIQKRMVQGNRFQTVTLVINSSNHRKTEMGLTDWAGVRVMSSSNQNGPVLLMMIGRSLSYIVMKISGFRAEP